MSALKNVLLFAATGYVALLALLYVAQRRIMYLPDAARITPAAVGFQAQAREISTADGEIIHAWYTPPSPGKPVFIYFHGNAGHLANRTNRLARLTADGAGLMAVSYRGYGGSSGSPSESGLIADARAAYAEALALGAAPGRIVLVGESLGAGVAIALAAEKPVAALLLEAPFSSAADIAANTYWMFPVRLLMHDPFRSDERIGRVNAPIMIVHGTADPVIPIAFGERLFARAREPKSWLRIEGAGHQPLDRPDVMTKALAWIEQRIAR